MLYPMSSPFIIDIVNVKEIKENKFVLALSKSLKHGTTIDYEVDLSFIYDVFNKVLNATLDINYTDSDIISMLNTHLVKAIEALPRINNYLGLEFYNHMHILGFFIAHFITLLSTSHSPLTAGLKLDTPKRDLIIYLLKDIKLSEAELNNIIFKSIENNKSLYNFKNEIVSLDYEYNLDNKNNLTDFFIKCLHADGRNDIFKDLSISSLVNPFNPAKQTESFNSIKIINAFTYSIGYFNAKYFENINKKGSHFLGINLLTEDIVFIDYLITLKGLFKYHDTNRNPIFCIKKEKDQIIKAIDALLQSLIQNNPPEMLKLCKYVHLIDGYKNIKI